MQSLHNYQIVFFVHKHVYHISKLPALIFIYFEEKKYLIVMILGKTMTFI